MGGGPLAAMLVDRVFGFVVGVLFVWRATHLVQEERGPWALFDVVRKRFGAHGAGRLFHCFYCLSLWIAAPVALYIVTGWLDRALVWPALSAGAILLERVTQMSHNAPAAVFTEDEPVAQTTPMRTDDVMLRPELTGDRRSEWNHS